MKNFVTIPGGDPPVRINNATDVYNRVSSSVDLELRHLRKQPRTAENIARENALLRSLSIANTRMQQEIANPPAGPTPQQYWERRGNEAISNKDHNLGQIKTYNTGGTLGKAGGAIAGQALIPIPGVGAAVGATVGQVAGTIAEKGIKSKNPWIRTATGFAIGGPAGALLGHLGIFGKGGKEKANFEDLQTGSTSQGASYEEGGVLKGPGRKKKMKQRQRSPEKKMAQGGAMPIGQDAMEFVGPTHAEGGIPIPGYNAEVEGGETLDNVKGDAYVFSKELKVPGTTISFADLHKKIIRSGANTAQVNKLAQMQERTKSNKPVNREMADGGFLASLLGSDGTLEAALPYAGAAANVAMGLMPTNVPDAVRIDSSPSATLKNATFNTDAQQAQLAAAQRTATAAPGATNNQRLAVHAQTLEGLAGLGQQKANIETGYKVQGAQMLQQTAAQNAQYAEQYRQDVQGAEAAKQNLLATGFTDIAKTNQAISRDKKAEDLQNKGLVIQTILGAGTLPEGDRRAVLESAKSILPVQYHTAFDAMITSGNLQGAANIIETYGIGAPSVSVIRPSDPLHISLPGIR